MLDNDWYHQAVRDRTGMEARVLKTSIPGTYQIEATIDFMPVAIGTVWYRWSTLSVIELLDSYVHHQFRRLGVRTWLQGKLQENYPGAKGFMTLGATKESKPWLRKMGFQKDVERVWRLTLEKKKKRV